MSTVGKGDASHSESGEAPAQKSPKLTNLMVLAILIAVVVLEVIVASFVLPSPAKVRSEVGPIIAGEVENAVKPKYDNTGKSPIKPEEKLEQDLGEFMLTERGNDVSEFRISIHFYGLINKSDEEMFKKKYEENKFRVRSAITIILRSTPSTEINDPVLGVVRNKVLVKVNEILGAPLVKGIIFTDIST
ncbi:MAG: hypothetical protein LBQ54_16415 [Planctomycetaceae bacterium]|jgi:hypothetical protein|nr:hypothetical protein [Planctomycetaceae bacterium]